MKRIIFALLIFIPFCTKAQSKTFHLGLKAEFYGYTHQEISSFGTYRKEFWISPLPAMYVLATYDLSELISLFVKPGLSFRPATGNFEAGLGLIYKISNHDYFLTSGVNTYFNRVEESKSNIYFIFLGIGYRLNQRLALDLTFHQVLNNEIAFYRTEKPDGPSKLFNMVKIGLAATF